MVCSCNKVLLSETVRKYMPFANEEIAILRVISLLASAGITWSMQVLPRLSQITICRLALLFVALFTSNWRISVTGSGYALISKFWILGMLATPAGCSGTL